MIGGNLGTKMPVKPGAHAYIGEEGIDARLPFACWQPELLKIFAEKVRYAHFPANFNGVHKVKIEAGSKADGVMIIVAKWFKDRS